MAVKTALRMAIWSLAGMALFTGGFALGQHPAPTDYRLAAVALGYFAICYSLSLLKKLGTGSESISRSPAGVERQPGSPRRNRPVVRTYPVPATKGVDVSCTAAITSEREWMRLFPAPYRFLDEDKRFKKYQWIDVAVTLS
jgi:hypothetical protein